MPEELRSTSSTHRRIAISLALLAVLLSSFLITRSYTFDNQTYDESAHIACGMEWLSRGTYYYETLHPPLARAATALLPYLDGARTLGKPTMLEEGNALLNLHGAYWKNLTLSRLGVLPFFWFACWLVFRFMAKRFSYWHAVIATALLAFCPPVLAHASLATTDAPLMTMFTWSLLSAWTFVERPTIRNTILAGLAIGLASLTKFTELPFFLLAAVLLLGYIAVRERRFPVPLGRVAIIIVMFPIIIWAGYRFSDGPILSQYTMSPSAAAKLKAASPREQKLLTATPVPADEFFRGLIMAKGTGSNGRKSFLLGQVYEGGKWDFFPVAILVKTPIPMLLLLFGGCGMFFLVPALRRRGDMFVLLLGVACPLAVGMAGNMNIGLRHVLPIYPFIAMLGAVAAMHFLQNARGRSIWAARGGVALLLGWEMIACVWTAPDFIPYFNVLAAGHADHILVNSDLDWGQSLYALERTLQADHAQSVAIDYFGDPGINMSGLPNHTVLQPGEHPTGWVAVSDTDYQEGPEEFGWLAHQPYTMIDHSIRLYDLPRR